MARLFGDDSFKPGSFFKVLKSAAKKIWKKSAKYVGGAVAGYEVHDMIDEYTGNNNNIVAPPQQVIYRQDTSHEDLVGANEIVVILLAAILILLVLILLIVAGKKIVSFIAKKAVERHRASIATS